MSKRLAELEAIVAASKADRTFRVSKFVPTIELIGRMVDQLGELHCELGDDDRLHQVLHSLAFVWENVETELLVAGGRAAN